MQKPFGIHILRTFLAAGAIFAAGTQCSAEQAHEPMEWTSIHTNAIARWKAENKAPGGVVADKEGRAVRVLVEATGVGTQVPVEFFAIGPLSDRAYEAFCVTVASPADIAAAIESVGVPRGVPPDITAARLWPQGETMAISLRPYGKEGDALALDKVLADVREKEEAPVLTNPISYTGGARDAAGMPEASTNIPCAVFALYRHSPSLLMLDGQFDQSATYGRFRSSRVTAQGDLFEMVLSWDGRRKVAERTVSVSSGTAAEAIAKLKAEVDAGKDLYVRLSFDASVTVAQAADVARAFEMLDGHGIKMNGVAPGQFFYKAFLPDPSWRGREGRLLQPFEIRIAADGSRSFTFIDEDWSGKGLDPVLKPRTTPFREWQELPSMIAATGEHGEKIRVALVFAPPETPVAALAQMLPAISSRIDTFYVFAE